jgi:hypothetical protein
VEKKEPSSCWWECKLVQPLWKKVWRLLKKLKIDLPYNPAILLLGIHRKECQNIIEAPAALFTIAKLFK